MRSVARPLFVAAALGFVSPTAARAGPLIQGGVEGSTGFYASNFMQGYDFTPTSDQFLTALGFWDQGADGLPRAFRVGLWDTDTETLVASAVIDNADPVDPSVTVAGGNWRYETLPAPVALTAGATYTLAFQVGSPDLSSADSLFITYPSLVVDPGVTVPNVARFLNTGGAFTFPTIALTAAAQFRGMVNARLTPAGPPAAVPEPAGVVLAGLGAAGLAARRVRRRGG